MIVPNDISINQSKSVSNKKTTSKKVSTSAMKPFMHVHDFVEPMSLEKEVVPNPTKKIIDHDKTFSEEPHVDPHVESLVDFHVEPNVEASEPTSDNL